MMTSLQNLSPVDMIDELKNKIDRLSLNTERLQSILKAVNLGIMLHGPDTELLVCNDTALFLLDREEKDIIGKRLREVNYDAVRRDGSKLEVDRFPLIKAISTKRPVHNIMFGVKRQTKLDIVWLSVNEDPVFHPDGSVKYVITSMIDISEQVRTEQELRSSEDKWKFALEGNGDGVWDWDIDNNYVFYSASYLDMLGYTAEEFNEPEVWESKLHSDDKAKVLKALQDHVNGVSLKPYSIEYRIRCKDGSYKWILGRGKVMSRDEQKRGTRMIGTHMDISESKNAEELLRSSLHEKDILLSEIHHRVKNNMAVISGLLSLQEGYFQDEHSKLLFLESQNRIKSMALIHEKLYQSENFSHIGFEGYIRDLVQAIEFSYNNSNKKIAIETEIVNGFLDLNNAVPCALVLNELLSNAYKHAFKGRRSGTVTIRFINNHQEYLMEVCDNGCGTDISKLRKTGSLGYTLIDALVKQLKGTMEMSSTEDGTRINIRFVSNQVSK